MRLVVTLVRWLLLLPMPAKLRARLLNWYTRHAYTGLVLETNGQKRTIVSYDPTTHTATIDSDWDEQPRTSDSYRMGRK